MKFDATKTIRSAEQVEGDTPAAAAVAIRRRHALVPGNLVGEIELEDQDGEGHWIVEPHMWCENCNGPIWTTAPPGDPGAAFRHDGDELWWHAECPTTPFPPLAEPATDEDLAGSPVFTFPNHCGVCGQFGVHDCPGATA